MPAHSNQPMQPLAPAPDGVGAGTAVAGCRTLAPGQALSLQPRAHGVLEVARGQVWLTLRGSLALLPGHVADHMLAQGERIAIAPGQHAVLEALNPQGARAAAVFRWEHVPDQAACAAEGSAPGRSLAAPADWERAVLVPLRELLHTLGRGGRALTTALTESLAAAARLAAGIARFSRHRLSAPLRRKPAG